MTIREVLKRRTRRILGIAFAAWLVLPILALATSDEPPLPLMFVALLVFFCALATLYFTASCPKCKARLGQLAGQIAFHWGTRGRVNFCPYCGVSLDGPCEDAAPIR